MFAHVILHWKFISKGHNTHAFVKLTNFIMCLGDSTVLITESDKVTSNICIFLSFSETVCFLSGGCADEANGHEE